MKNRGMLAALILVLIAVLLPVSAFALTGAPAAGSYGTSAGNKSARDYVISFGNESAIGIRDTWTVYSAPALNAVRGANGKAEVYTSEGVYSAGWYGAWLLIRYQKNNGGFRVGWVPNTEITSGKIQATRSVDFAYWQVTLAQNCTLTDDPLLESEALAYASKGEQLTYLGYYQYKNGREYAYVQGELDGRPICGFIPFDAIAW